MYDIIQEPHVSQSLHSHQGSQESAIQILHREVSEYRISKELEDLAHAVTEEKIAASNSLNTFTLQNKGKDNKYFPSCYQKLKGERIVNEKAVFKSR